MSKFVRKTCPGPRGGRTPETRVLTRQDRPRTRVVARFWGPVFSLDSENRATPEEEQTLQNKWSDMRHSDPKLTANVYCDPKLLDVRGARDSLPSLPLTLPGGGQEQARATGTYGAPVQDFVAPDVALPPGDERASLATAGNPSTEGCLPDGTGKSIEDNGFGDPCVSLTIPGKGTDHHPMPGPNGRAPAISADAHRSSARPRRSSSAAGASGRGSGGGRRA